MSYHGIASLPSGTRMDPTAPEDNEYFEQGVTIYVLENVDNGKRSVFSSWGSGWMTLGEVKEYHHDQAGYSFGFLKVIGIIDTVAGTVVGEIPARKLPHRVAK